MSQFSERSKNSGAWVYSCIAGGLLLGLATPSFSFLPMGFLAWFWAVPLLLELKKINGFLPYLARVLAAVGLGFSLTTLWVVHASVAGFFASATMGIIVWSLPFVLIYPVRRWLGWKWAVIALPFAWTAWEWAYHLTDFSFGAVRLAHTQSEFLWLIQYADITSVHGITFWVVAINVAIFLLLEKLAELKNTTREFARVAPEAAFTVALFVLPLSYAGYVFMQPELAGEEITILATQPNVSPFAEYSTRGMREIFAKELAMTDNAINENAPNLPDLVVWHEAALPYTLSDNTPANEYLATQIAKWNTPILTGLIEVHDYTEDEARPALLEAQNRYREFFNAAAVFKPSDIVEGRLPIDLSAMYRKRRLMPFLEQVPLSSRFPFLSDLIIPIGVRPRLSAGTNIKTLSFQTRSGATSTAGVTICYENLYPEMSGDTVGDGGAQFLAAITNEGFFAGSQGQFQLAAVSRFRSIETRRAMVRVAATGMTRVTDRFGRTTAEVPMLSEQTMTARVRLSDEQTVYVRAGNFFPKICLMAFVLIILTGISRFYRK